MVSFALKEYLAHAFKPLIDFRGRSFICIVQVAPLSGKMSLNGLNSFIEDWAGNGLRRQGLYGSAWIRTDAGPWVEATHGAGAGPNAKNRNVFLSEDKTKLGMTTGGPDLSDTSLGPYDVVGTSIPTVLTLNSLPDRDGAPSLERKTIRKRLHASF